MKNEYSSRFSHNNIYWVSVIIKIILLERFKTDVTELAQNLHRVILFGGKRKKLKYWGHLWHRVPIGETVKMSKN